MHLQITPEGRELMDLVTDLQQDWDNGSPSTERNVNLARALSRLTFWLEKGDTFLYNQEAADETGVEPLIVQALLRRGLLSRTPYDRACDVASEHLLMTNRMRR